MKKLLMALSLVALITACSSLKPDYRVKAAKGNTDKVPTWILKASKNDDSSRDNETHAYFAADAENANQRLCEQDAKARATAMVAERISQQLLNVFNAAVKGTASEASSFSSDQLKQEINASLSGVEVRETYWQRRAYLKEMGAMEDREVYYCTALVRIKNELLAKAMDAAITKMVDSVKPAQRESVKTELQASKADFITAN